jgi:hypothetical protein
LSGPLFVNGLLVCGRSAEGVVKLKEVREAVTEVTLDRPVGLLIPAGGHDAKVEPIIHGVKAELSSPREVVFGQVID